MGVRSEVLWLVVGIALVISMFECSCVVVAVFAVSILSGDILTGGVLVSVMAIVWALRVLDTSA